MQWARHVWNPRVQRETKMSDLAQGHVFQGLLWGPLAAAACLLPVGLGQTLACGTSFVTTSAKTYPRCRCPCSSTSRSTRCRGFARSWSTAASWTRPAA